MGFWKQFHRQNLHSTKSKMAAAAIMKFTLPAITRPLLHVFVRNFARELKMTSRKQICSQNLFPTAFKMATSAVLKFTLTAITGVTPIRGKCDVSKVIYVSLNLVIIL